MIEYDVDINELMRRPSPLELAMIAHLWNNTQIRGYFDLDDAASWAPFYVAEDQPGVSRKWNEAHKIVAFNVLHGAHMKRFWTETWPKKAPKRVPACGYWECQFAWTDEGKHFAVKWLDEVRAASRR